MREGLDWVFGQNWIENLRVHVPPERISHTRVTTPAGVLFGVPMVRRSFPYPNIWTQRTKRALYYNTTRQYELTR